MLIRDDAEAIQIENNAVITYDSNITIQSDGKETEIIKEGAVQPGKQNTLIVPYGSPFIHCIGRRIESMD